MTNAKRQSRTRKRSRAVALTPFCFRSWICVTPEDSRRSYARFSAITEFSRDAIPSRMPLERKIRHHSAFWASHWHSDIHSGFSSFLARLSAFLPACGEIKRHGNDENHVLSTNQNPFVHRIRGKGPLSTNLGDNGGNGGRGHGRARASAHMRREGRREFLVSEVRTGLQNRGKLILID